MTLEEAVRMRGRRGREGDRSAIAVGSAAKDVAHGGVVRNHFDGIGVRNEKGGECCVAHNLNGAGVRR